LPNCKEGPFSNVNPLMKTFPSSHRRVNTNCFKKLSSSKTSCEISFQKKSCEIELFRENTFETSEEKVCSVVLLTREREREEIKFRFS
jgi:hypothetical protein